MPRFVNNRQTGERPRGIVSHIHRTNSMLQICCFVFRSYISSVVMKAFSSVVYGPDSWQHSHADQQELFSLRDAELPSFSIVLSVESNLGKT